MMDHILSWPYLTRVERGWGGRGGVGKLCPPLGFLLVCWWLSTIVAYYGFVNSLLQCLSFRNWMLFWLFGCSLDSYFVQYNIFFCLLEVVCRFQLKNLSFFPQLMSPFVVMLKINLLATHNIEWEILSFFQTNSFIFSLWYTYIYIKRSLKLLFSSR